jgi:predicted TIM-barrel fold metal-dependent hydrolase
LLPLRSFSRAVWRVTVGSTVVALCWLASPRLPAQQSLSIEEYQPRSTLVVAAHPVPRARFPVIDIHSHHPAPLAPAAWSAIAGEMDALNLRILVNLSGGSGESLRQALDVIESGPHKGRMIFFANLDFGGIGRPDWATRAAAALEADVKAGAMGLKIFKNFGLRVARNGRRVPVDDPELDPIWRTCARLGIPVLIHTGEPAPFFEPVDRHNERWLELNIHPGRRVPAAQYPTFEALMGERDRLFLRHRGTIFIAAHMAWHANDLGRLGSMLDRMPNVRVETGAILAELGRQPRTAHDFFVKYQDRILFGKDTYEASEYPYYWRTFETRDEYFDYYRHYHAFWKLYGMGLPDGVLRKVYYANALSLLPRVSSAWFPAPATAAVR